MNGGDGVAHHQVRNWHELQRACDRAADGDTIHVFGGHYGTPARLEKKRGITIKAADGEWISGGISAEPRPDAPPKPSATDQAFLGIDDCERIAVEGLKIRDYWPTIFFVKDTKYLAIRNCVLRHGTYAIFAKGKTSHLLIDRNEWQQDDSPEHRLWREIDWKRAHGGEGADGRFSYFNGGFLSTKGIRGAVIVSGNRIMDAYNGIRMKSGDKAPDAASAFATTNANVHIVDNDFIRIRDNPTEPEVFAYDWHVRHNRLLDCHSWFSFDGVEGGYWYYYGNTGRFESRQGHYGEFGHTMGRVLKLSYAMQPPGDGAGAKTPQFPWHVFNNSWHLRCPLIGGARAALPAASEEPVEGPDFTANLAFFNNAFAWCDAAQYGSWVCEKIDLIHNFDFTNSRETAFDYSITDNADYITSMRKTLRQEANGILATRTLFEDACCGDFRPAESSEARRSGDLREIALPKDRADTPAPQRDGTLNRGAVQDYGLTKVLKLEAQYDQLRDDITDTLKSRIGGGRGVASAAAPRLAAGARGKPAGKR